MSRFTLLAYFYFPNILKTLKHCQSSMHTFKTQRDAFKKQQQDNIWPMFLL